METLTRAPVLARLATRRGVRFRARAAEHHADRRAPKQPNMNGHDHRHTLAHAAEEAVA